MKEKMENFSHTARITDFHLTGRIKPEDSPAEADIELDVKANDNKSLRLKCFSYESEPDDLHTGKLRIGDNVRVKFTLSTGVHNVIALKQKARSIVPESDKQGHAQHYMAKGKILRIEPHPNKEMTVHKKRIILDCGIYVTTSISVNSALKVGDYIRTNGRLDGFVLEKVK